MEALGRAPAFPPQSNAVKTVGTDVAGGSPSSSTSCHDSHAYCNTSALQATEGPLRVRTHHFRKNSHLNTSTLAAQGDAAPEAPNEVPEAQLPPAKPAGRPSRRKPTKQWEEEDIREPGPRAGRRKVIGKGPTLRSKWSQAAVLATPEEESQADAHSPVSDDSASTRRASSPRAAQRRRPSLDAVSEEIEQHQEEEGENRPRGNLKPGGPCYVCWVTESPAWRTGKVHGLFPGAALCNSHGTLDRRNRLGRCCDVEGIIQLHKSGWTDEEKAAASQELLKDFRAARKSPAKVHRTRAAASQEEDEAVEANARSRVRRKPAAVAKRLGKADAAQPWGTRSPTQAAGGRKRKARSGSNDDDDADPAMASRKRLFVQRKAEAVAYVERAGTRSEYNLGEVATEMEVDSSGSDDDEIRGAVAGLVSMRRSGSSEMYHVVL